jgi:hypothetical protein
VSDQGDPLEAWDKIRQIDQTMLPQVLSEFAKLPCPIDVLRRAIGVPHERGVALRLLMFIGGSFGKQVFQELVESASVGHADVALCRAVLKTLPRRWVVGEIDQIVLRLLKASPDDDEMFRRFAELYVELDDCLLMNLVRLAASSEFEAVREVAADFSIT